MLTSLLENNKEEHFDVFVLIHEGVNLCDLEKLPLAYSCSIIPISVNEDVFSEAPIRYGDHVTIETYFRLVASRLLPENIEKILYMDGDIIINCDIQSLWNTDLEGYAIGAVIDESYSEHTTRLDIDSYFSAGVLLMNLKYWREHNVTERCVQCLAEIPDKLLFHDQDVLNIVLQNETLLLPLKYNFQTGYYLAWKYPGYPIEMQRQIKIVAENPAIIHYSGPMKPWVVSSDHPFKARFLYYRHLSPWRSWPLKHDASVFTQVKLAFGRVARRVGLLSPKYVISPRRISIKKKSKANPFEKISHGGWYDDSRDAHQISGEKSDARVNSRPPVEL